ncbi:methylmalonyl-CoA epimerase [Actinocrinis puniceicyclus]|uniref:Methylmalonyl-CoA epimerase n=1 Tax=Actinocrinis puniceicyclus TaxID=977794 RepID=A0A8J7WKG6_9ACTN|nr:methylmalonyl-CoA epimerase [Actinocrinis puniceicyclus]MBS2962973.1 methylmalonyl-CoA epimerase [Actinocrinis puniceicyclus]
MSEHPVPPAAHLEDIGLRGIDHVGVAVADLDQAVDFYQRVFGMRCIRIEENADEGVREATMSVGPDPVAGRLQLLAPLSPHSTIARFLDRQGPGLQQIAYRVADLDVACEKLRSRGVRLIHKTPRRGTAGSRINFIFPQDAGGVLVELVEQPSADFAVH